MRRQVYKLTISPLSRSSLSAVGLLRMVDANQVDVLRRGAKAWNSWRQENPAAIPDISGLALSLGERQFGPAHGGPIDFRSVKLRDAFLRFATLSDANLESADLSNADLTHAKLQNANLYRADFSNAVLDHVDFAGAIFAKANLTGASLKNARNLTEDQIAKCIGDFSTVLPSNLRRPATWPSESGARAVGNVARVAMPSQRAAPNTQRFVTASLVVLVPLIAVAIAMQFYGAEEAGPRWHVLKGNVSGSRAATIQHQPRAEIAAVRAAEQPDSNIDTRLRGVAVQEARAGTSERDAPLVEVHAFDAVKRVKAHAESDRTRMVLPPAGSVAARSADPAMEVIHGTDPARVASANAAAEADVAIRGNAPSDGVVGIARARDDAVGDVTPNAGQLPSGTSVARLPEQDIPNDAQEAALPPVQEPTEEVGLPLAKPKVASTPPLVNQGSAGNTASVTSAEGALASPAPPPQPVSAKEAALPPAHVPTEDAGPPLAKPKVASRPPLVTERGAVKSASRASVKSAPKRAASAPQPAGKTLQGKISDVLAGGFNP